ncbi:MAG: Histone-lysine N-methyltransferase NSD3 [Paramarteilia canceri]
MEKRLVGCPFKTKPEIGSVVWAIHSKYPPWPAVIIPSIQKETFSTNQSTSTLHVKFLGEEARAEVNLTNLSPFLFDRNIDLDKHIRSVNKKFRPKLKKAIDEAYGFKDVDCNEVLNILKRSSNFLARFLSKNTANVNGCLTTSKYGENLNSLALKLQLNSLSSQTTLLTFIRKYKELAHDDQLSILSVKECPIRSEKYYKKDDDFFSPSNQNDKTAFLDMNLKRSKNYSLNLKKIKNHIYENGSCSIENDLHQDMPLEKQRKIEKHQNSVITTVSKSKIGKSKNKIISLPYKLMIETMNPNYVLNFDHITCHLCLRKIESSEEVLKCKTCSKNWHQKCFPGKTLTDSSGEKLELNCEMCSKCLRMCIICRIYDYDLEKCSYKSCDNHFHSTCMKNNNIAQKNSKGYYCSQHFCKTCFNKDPENIKKQMSKPLLKCINCPTACHANDFCMLAGSTLLTENWMNCSLHINYPKNKISVVHANFCYACGKEKGLLKCSECPTCYHPKCIRLVDEAFSSTEWKCEECLNGRVLNFGQIVWGKIRRYPWWPGQIVHPRYSNDSVRNFKHKPGEFLVHFFGSNDFAWMHSGQVYMYYEGDDQEQYYSFFINDSFKNSLKQANAAFQIYKNLSQQIITNYHDTYKTIRTNIPFGNVTVKKATLKEIPVCNCSPEEGACLDKNCINYSTKFECNAKVCPAGEFCQNQQFIKRKYPDFQVFKSDKKGFGLKVLEPVKKEQFVNEYIGELIDKDELTRRIEFDHRSNITNYYYLSLDRDRTIDASNYV